MTVMICPRRFTRPATSGDARVVPTTADWPLPETRWTKYYLSGWESLTTSERAVAELVGEGLTTRAIARHLFTSPHTVNTHLRHAFQKLDVSTRADLATRVSRQRST